jgi:hypothetical protein
VVFFDLDKCPTGWTELEGAQGRVLVGLPPDGELGGTVGKVLGDLEDRSHTHLLQRLTAGTTSSGAHGHTIPDVSLTTISSGSHRHNVGSASQMASMNSGTGPGFTAASANHLHDVEPDGEHSHDLTLQGLHGSHEGTHQHQVAVVGNTSEARTSDVMPYMQLLVCRRD